MQVLVVNAGSQSIKLSVLHDGETVLRQDLEPSIDALAEYLGHVGRQPGQLDAVGHRVVHGGRAFSEAVIVDEQVREALEQASELAPLHNPSALAGIDLARRLLPQTPSVACFDTAFHATLPPEASTYAVPSEWVQRWGIRRFGFHGLSCAWAVRRCSEMLGRPADRMRIVVCHLGGGASVTAIAGGRSVDTTMGFTPLEGLVMATRSGDLDPGALLWALQHGLSVDDASYQLEHRSGLLGLSGGRTSDMQELLAARAAGDATARRAIAAYVHRLQAKIAAMAAATRGVDALVFTAGVGENSADIVSETCAGLAWMGVELAVFGSPTDADRDVSRPDAAVRVLVIHAREDLEVAAECSKLLSS